MPPFPGIPYGSAPAFCFPLTEISMYVLFIFCVLHAKKKGLSHICYLFGGLLFGLMLEYINVISDMGYIYGKFMVMFGTPPFDVPLCIGIGWSIIMYSARVFTDTFGLTLWPSVAMDALLAVNIDLSMDTVAYRLHMWHWEWADTNQNPLTSDWFGIPYGNFFGWLLVIFFYSSFSRLLEKTFAVHTRENKIDKIITPVLAVAFSQAALYLMLVYIDKFLFNKFGITSLHRFVSFLLFLILLVFIGWRNKKKEKLSTPFPAITWLVPLWFHLYFFLWLFAEGFYRESTWLAVAAFANLIIGIGIHLRVLRSGPREISGVVSYPMPDR